MVKKPSQLTFTQAACLPNPTATASAALFGKTDVSVNSRILIDGCTGVVGLMALQLAAAKGAIVAGTCSTTSIDLASAMGVNEVFNYADEQYQSLPWKQVNVIQAELY